MRNAVAAFVVVVCLVGCGQSESTQVGDPPGASAAPLVASDLIGRWQFVLTPEVREAYRARIAAKIGDPVALEQAMKDAEAEARASELELTADFVFVSRVLGEELVRKPVRPRVASPSTIVLDEGTKEKKIVFVDHDTISIDEPGKGQLIYTRVK